MIAYGSTNKGMVRPTNQDNYAVELFDSANTALLVVCDGMGGASAGNVASRYAIERFAEEVRQEIQPNMDNTYMEDLLRVGAQYANQSVFELSIQQPEFRPQIHQTVARGRAGQSDDPLCQGTHLQQASEPPRLG